MRDTFHAEIDRLVDLLLRMGDHSREMLDDAMRSIVERDGALAAAVRRRDDEVDRLYERVQEGLLRCFALQAPVGVDLRLLSAMLHVNIHVERMGDYAASTAKVGQLSSSLPDEPALAEQLREMATAAVEVGQVALRSFAQRDEAAARGLPALDDRVDRLNIGLFQRLVRLAGRDELRLEWATHMILIARQIERYADHAVDIGEQTVFAVTGTTVELSSNTPGGA